MKFGTLFDCKKHLGFMEKAENIVFLGPPGVGKTHLAIALGIKACFAKKRVLFSTASELADDLVVAYSTKTLAGRLLIPLQNGPFGNR